MQNAEFAAAVLQAVAIDKAVGLAKKKLGRRSSSGPAAAAFIQRFNRNIIPMRRADTGTQSLGIPVRIVVDSTANSTIVLLHFLKRG